ncbi:MULTISPECIES: choloylglycine hydrolase family protein [Vagococcus]|uniref:Choloylglycine hydrolase n=1 Tax=Vagococcus fluvialis bH819 TaxID=1255619 RepID=A0A1X6WK91_9ENTE|nr:MULTISPECIES: choloylglycine hydrolase family protein [Vagococcus]SLM84695.1 Choloylglycine hydrolase [Vagococcus fluvialis bH819]HCM89842.1 linear amide C-N hydrolase [Vagococcus sp.]
MCTSIIYQNKMKQAFLARTMDFSYPLDGKPVFIPSNYEFFKGNKIKSFTSKYAFVGSGDLHGEYVLADGLNEEGLSAASLYFSADAVYSDEKNSDQVAVAPHDVVAWLLSMFKTVEEIKEGIWQLNIINEKNSLLKKVIPLHWIVADQSGKSIVIESVVSGIEVYDNPVNVMTNSPSFTWHLTNLNQYANLSNASLDPIKYGQFTAYGNGAGSGGLGLPGDFTSISRFIRIAFMNQYIEKVETTEASLNIIMRMLTSVYIPKGVKKKSDGRDDYTQFISMMDLNQITYYINYYEDNQLFKISLDEQIKKQVTPKIFECSKKVMIQKLN